MSQQSGDHKQGRYVEYGNQPGQVLYGDDDEGGSQTLAETLAVGNETGGTDVVISVGDSIVGEAGDVEMDADVHITGKLTVDGPIDPTALILDEAPPPSTPAGDGGVFVSDGSAGLDQNDLYYRHESDGDIIKLNLGVSYNNIAMIAVQRQRQAEVNLGVPVWDADFRVICQRRNYNWDTTFVSDGATNANQVELVGAVWDQILRSEDVTLGIEVQSANTAAGQIRTRSYLQGRYPINTLVYNLRTAEWGRITAYTAVDIATVTGFASGHNTNDVLEMYQWPDSWGIRNVDLGVWRGVSGFSSASPSVLPFSAPIPGTVPGHTFRISASELWQWSTDGAAIPRVSFPIANSDPPSQTRLNIHNPSNFSREYVVAWRT